MPTKTSAAIYIMSILAAEAGVLKAAGCLTLACVLSYNMPIVEMILAACAVTLPWLGYSPLYKPLGSPDKE